MIVLHAKSVRASQTAPEAFMGMLEGRNFRKLIVRVDT